MLKINYSYTDEFGQETTLSKSYQDSVLEIDDHFTLLVGEFKNFLLVAGFTHNMINKITVEE